MRSLHVALALGVISLAARAPAQDAAAPALFPVPIPGVYPAYPVAQIAARNLSWYDSQSPALSREQSNREEPSPSDRPAPPPVERTPVESLPPADSIISPDYQGAMKGDFDGGTAGYGTCGEGAGGRHKYVYANGLVMTHLTNGGFATSVDLLSGDTALEFSTSEYGRLWHGGFEVGAGCCFGCNCGLEVVYWGLYAAPGTVTAEGTLDSLIDFADVDYGGGDCNAIFDGASTHRVIFDQGLHSVEVNMLGNYGGPLGCGRVGCCDKGCGGAGCRERWGFGWLAGFRYVNFTEDWLFSAEVDDNVFDDEADQLNYEVDLQNNLIGFQMGVGFDYCITPAFQAYTIGKVGIYGNDIQMQQRLYGSGGLVTLNGGDFVGDEFDLSSSDFDLAMSGQIDVGGRYAITPSWTLDFGWRVLALSGVAIAADNVAQNNLQDIEAIRDIQTAGSLLLHGGYAGLTYAW